MSASVDVACWRCCLVASCRCCLGRPGRTASPAAENELAHHTRARDDELPRAGPVDSGGVTEDQSDVPKDLSHSIRNGLAKGDAERKEDGADDAVDELEGPEIASLPPEGSGRKGICFTFLFAGIQAGVVGVCGEPSE